MTEASVEWLARLVVTLCVLCAVALDRGRRG